MKPTPEQQAAAHAPGSVAVTAGAGTGKTRMLAERYLYHVTTDGLSPLEVVAVTFSDKAADELRSRIRATISKNVPDPETAAEVDAAQISTIHALAARICRDFYFLADIPADFRILDDTDGEMWRIAQIDAALQTLSIETVEAVTFSRLVSAMKKFLDDPLVAEQALSVSSDLWKQEIDSIRSRAIEDFLNSEEFAEALEVLPRYQGASDDILEVSRLNGLEALNQIKAGRDIASHLETLSRLRAHLGQKGNWQNGGLSEVRQVLRAVKESAGDCLGLATLEFNAADEELFRQVQILSQAFETVRDAVQKEKRDARLLDYNDLEIKALEILEQPVAREHYNKRWKAVMVDEFQDTNEVQAKIIRLLTEDARITIVGDEKQSIYGFRGAEVAVFGEFRQEIITAGRGSSEKLSTSFRTHESLVRTTNKIFQPILEDMHQELDAFRPESPLAGPHIELRAVDQQKGSSAEERLNIEAANLSEQIQRLMDTNAEVFDKDTKTVRPIEYGDIAILSRAWAPLDAFVDALSANGIPAVHAGGGDLLETREAKDVFALLSFIANPHDDIALVALLRSPFFAVSDRTLLEFVKNKPDSEGWWEAMKRDPGPLSREHGIIAELINGRSRLTAQALVTLADDLTGYSAIIANLPHGVRREADWKGVMALLVDFEKKGRDDAFSVSRFIQQLLRFEVELPRPRLDAGNAVQLTTIHGAKGLEWPIVFVPALTRKNISDRNDLKVDAKLGVAFKIGEVEGEAMEPAIYKVISVKLARREHEESKRVLYVALTRAQEKIFLSAASTGDAEDLKILRPGLDNASVVTIPIPFSSNQSVPATPQSPEVFPSPEILQVGALSMGLTELHVTGLTEYRKCPKQFRFRHIDGHPGIREGHGSSRVIGILTHRALEKDYPDYRSLKHTDPLATDRQAEEAFSLARNFKTKSVYDSVRVPAVGREINLQFEREGLSLFGVADLLAEEFVLDYKTDREADPQEHSLQLWTYARALGKETAHIAYLRHDMLHTFDKADLERMDEAADHTIRNIVEGRFDPTPSEHVCKFCPYWQICEDKISE